jgi:hypothetical protein
VYKNLFQKLRSTQNQRVADTFLDTDVFLIRQPKLVGLLLPKQLIQLSKIRACGSCKAGAFLIFHILSF